jgi:hypothetical protein
MLQLKPMSKGGKPKAKRADATEATVSLSVIQQIQDSGKKTHLRATTTRKNYGGHIKRARDWIKSHYAVPTGPAEVGMDASTSANVSVPHLDDLTGEDDVDNDFYYHNPKFKMALDDAPNEYSGKALALYISYKCFYQNLTQSMADGIYSAFKHYWEVT